MSVNLLGRLWACQWASVFSFLINPPATDGFVLSNGDLTDLGRNIKTIVFTFRKLTLFLER